MEPIRVLHVFGSLNSGGAESRTMDIYREIDRNKIQFDFLVHTKTIGEFEPEIKQLGGRIYRVPRLNLKTVFRYIKELKIFFDNISSHQIVHAHMLSTAFIYLFLAKKKKVQKRIAHSRNSSRSQLSITNIVKEITEKMSRFFATDMFAVSKYAGYSKFGKKKVDSGEVKIIPNSIKAEKFGFDEKTRKNIREKLDVQNQIVVGHVGRFQSQKNHLFLLDIFYELCTIKSNFLLILIGDGPLKHEIKSKIEKLGMKDKVILLGIRSDVQDLLQAIDVLVFPSTHEGFPGVVLESQAAGLPCVISSKITEEVNLTKQVKYVSLSESSSCWANETIAHMNKNTRKNNYDIIKNSGYDIKSTAKWYEEFYLT